MSIAKLSAVFFVEILDKPVSVSVYLRHVLGTFGVFLVLVGEDALVGVGAGYVADSSSDFRKKRPALQKQLIFPKTS